MKWESWISYSCALTVILLLLAVPVSYGYYTVVDTGQDECYDDLGTVIYPSQGDSYYGQDAQYNGTQPSLQDNGDGSVTDLNTGLTWQQSPSSSSFTWSEAVDYCDDLVLAGYSDWRIPSLKELFSISDFTVGWPYLETCFDLAGGTVSKDEQYWTSNFYVGLTHGGAPSAFGVNHGTGHIKAYPAETPGPMGNYVRAVRGGTYGINDLTDNGDGTVTDEATGLMWQQDDSGAGMDWEDALAYAEGLTLAGHGDWRLPNVKELQSIVDYTHSPNAIDSIDLGPAIDTDFFNITALPAGTTNYDPDYGYFWSSTSAYYSPEYPDCAYGWYVAFGTAPDGEGADTHGAGAVRYDLKSENSPPLPEDDGRIFNFVRCVRDTGTGIEEGEGGSTPVLSLTPEGPNPFSGSVQLGYDLTMAGRTDLSVYDLSGRRVATLLSGELPSGSGSVVWDASASPSGVYLCVLESSGSRVSSSLVLLR